MFQTGLYRGYPRVCSIWALGIYCAGLLKFFYFPIDSDAAS